MYYDQYCWYTETLRYWSKEFAESRTLVWEYTYVRIRCSVMLAVQTWQKYIILFILCIVTFVIYVYQHMHMNSTKLQTTHMNGLLYVSVTNCRPQGDIIMEEYIILILQINIYSVRNMYIIADLSIIVWILCTVWCWHVLC